MAATVVFSESNGAVEVVTDNISNINLGSADTPNLVPASHPVSVGGQSYMKWLRVKLVSLGGSTQINNMKIWKSSGVYVTGEIIGSNTNNILNPIAGAWGCPTYGFSIKPGGPVAVVPMPYNLTGQGVFGGNTTASTPVKTAIPGDPNICCGGVTTFNLVGAGSYSDYNVFQMTTTALTPLGPVNQKIFTFQYDES